MSAMAGATTRAAPTYNRLVHVPNEWSHEKMWRDDGLYDLVVVVGYNDDPPEGEMGAAPSSSTSHTRITRQPRVCVAFARDDLLELVTLIGPETRLKVLSTTAADEAPPSDGEQDMKLLEDFDEKDW